MTDAGVAELRKRFRGEDFAVKIRSTIHADRNAEDAENAEEERVSIFVSAPLRFKILRMMNSLDLLSFAVFA